VHLVVITIEQGDGGTVLRETEGDGFSNLTGATHTGDDDELAGKIERGRDRRRVHTKLAARGDGTDHAGTLPEKLLPVLVMWGTPGLGVAMTAAEPARTMRV
jgi:hypothetical protein